MLAVTLAAVVLLVNQALTASFRDYVDDQASARLQRAENILTRYHARRRDWSGVDSNLQSVAELMGERLVLADAQGRVVADSQGVLVGEREQEQWRGRRVTIRGDELAVGTLYISPTLDGERPVDARGQIFLDALKGYLAWAVGIGLLAAVALSLGLARWLAGPIEALTRAARRMERGQLDQRIVTSVGGEVGALADAFNALALSLARVETLRKSMVSDIAHELRTPLSSIRGYVEAIQDGVVQADADTLATIHREMMQLTRLIDDLQELSLAEARQLPLHLEEIDLAEVVAWEVQAFRPRAIASQVSLTIDRRPLPRSLVADAGRIRQVVANIIRNALAYTPAGGSVRVLVWGDGAVGHVVVTDSGVGMSEEDRQHIFERFYRADRARSRRAGGSGLGLTIARELVVAHGGEIRVDSELGAGSRFEITLPYLPPRPAGRGSERPLEAAPVLSAGIGALLRRGAVVGALLGAMAGTAESTLAAAVMRRPLGFLDVFGYAVLIDAAVFATLGASGALLLWFGARLSRRPLSRLRLTSLLVPPGCVVLGALVAYRWTQLFSREGENAWLESIAPVTFIGVGALGLALGTAGLIDFARTRLRAPTVAGSRRAASLALVAMLSSATVLVGRDQLSHQLADVPAATAATATRRATTPRSASARPPAEPTRGPVGGVSFDARGDPSIAPTSVRPNVLVITVTGLRADHLGAYGYPSGRTPSIDALARSGSLFANAFTPQPNSSAAHAGLFTGRSGTAHGIRHDLVDQLDPGVFSLPQLLADRGYRTGAVYSWAGFEPAYSGLDRGFHDYLDLTINRPEYLTGNQSQALAATYERLKAYLAVPGAMNAALGGSQPMDEALESRADVTTDAAIAWIEEHVGSPFLLWVHYFDPHEPFAPPPAFAPSQAAGCGSDCPDGSLATIRRIEAGAQLSAAQVNHLVGLYDGEIAFTDQEIGRLVRRLASLGIDRSTVVILTADHGQSFAEHDAWLNGTSLFNAETRVPLLVTYPGRLPDGRLVSAPASTLDVLPTLMDVLGLPAPVSLEGRSLVGLMSGDGRRLDRTLVSELEDQSQFAATDGQWKLIFSPVDGSRRLYNLSADPNELTDRSLDEPRVVARLMRALEQWRATNPN